ncbi:MAG: hypothetical protein H5U40_09660 [Polyangiaceae bacterium]|nr:hypothetical protein [Polyangiaceae bacterium]
MDTIGLVIAGLGGLATSSAAALAGYEVVLVPIDDGPSTTDVRQAVISLAKARGESAVVVEAALARIWISPSLEAVRRCSLVIDCAEISDLVTRAHLLRRLEAHMSYGAVLATDDPSFERLGPALARPTQFLALLRDGSAARLELRETGDTAPGAVLAVREFCRGLERVSLVTSAA